ncbi:hypothetical protein TPHA_0I02740 [Tetrapisispora phaffii CBS 4417]|uniref:Nucleolar protein Dnt1-like N-terminal domain-containing protein n=1 Tax=Tetrapisispora phaffii (strain ATCC 24235 / CBS 4417 / NBRC 1672 / NRRL Y-8282 / UCD 70-5) TaxID=1071381 RepID=G8BXZ7_TETPH|nr:hypothetical protein TPHA_0I02740 [Tetrapisispora phaffii CBS 4417]CCE64775.1 hypothetical protein TPHA_0I02740 [Tetrapisispora phaffii CBS 4417]
MMYKIQVILIPPNSIDNSYYRVTSSNAFINNLNINNENATLNKAPFNGSGFTGYGNDQNINKPNSNDSMIGSSYNSMIFNPYNSMPNTNLLLLFPNYKKFLLFTKPDNTLLTVSNEIVTKCLKLYPGGENEIDILSLQDINNCDLDPDFIVKDVFVTDNIIKVILKNDINITSPSSLFSSNKKQKINNGTSINTQIPPYQPLQAAPVNTQNGYSNANGGITVIKKRQGSGNNIIRNGLTSNTMRISTPLVHQIYSRTNKHLNNSDDENENVDDGNDNNDMEAMDRSFLPPPHQPQSPPIRISSDFDSTKKIKSLVEDDTVSKSETVDPVKAKQQRIFLGTPIRNASMPNGVCLTGQKVMSEQRYSSLDAKSSIFANTRSISTVCKGNDKIALNDSRITSGMLSIPEPKLSEVEKQLHEGPSSPSTILPPKPDRIPMKKPYIPDNSDSDSDSDYMSDSSSSINSESSPSIEVKQNIIVQDMQRPTENGSPAPSHIKNNNRAKISDQVSDSSTFKLAELPQTGNVKGLNNKEEESKQKGNVKGSDDKEEESKQNGNSSQTLKPDTKGNINLEKSLVNSNKFINKLENVTLNNITSEAKEKPNNFSKHEILSMVDGNELDLNRPFKNLKGTSNKKPYTTVLHKDIDNSKPDPRNILPTRLPRNAARRAAEKLSTRYETISKFNADNDSTSESDSESSSGNESDRIASDVEADGDKDRLQSATGKVPHQNHNIVVRENNEIKKLNIHDLNTRVITSDPNTSTANTDKNIIPKQIISEKNESLSSSTKPTPKDIPGSQPPANTSRGVASLPNREVELNIQAPILSKKNNNIPVFEESNTSTVPQILRKPSFLESEIDSEVNDVFDKTTNESMNPISINKIPAVHSMNKPPAVHSKNQPPTIRSTNSKPSAAMPSIIKPSATMPSIIKPSATIPSSSKSSTTMPSNSIPPIAYTSNKKANNDTKTNSKLPTNTTNNIPPAFSSANNISAAFTPTNRRESVSNATKDTIEMQPSGKVKNLLSSQSVQKLNIQLSKESDSSSSSDGSTDSTSSDSDSSREDEEDSRFKNIREVNAALQKR